MEKSVEQIFTEEFGPDFWMQDDKEVPADEVEAEDDEKEEDEDEEEDAESFEDDAPADMTGPSKKSDE